MASRTCSKQLMKVLTTPSKVANSLDWKKSTGGAIATMNVHANRIGITISQHPSSSSSTTTTKNSNNSNSNSNSNNNESSSSSSSSSSSYSLPIRQKGLRKIPDSSRQQLSELVKEHNVCGFVVSWPIQQDTGLMGASCGRTLFAIEELLSSPPQQQSQSQVTTTIEQQQQQHQQVPVFTPSRPICLWDGVHQEQPAADAFGRSSVYTQTSDKAEHRASKEQYHQDESIAVVRVWEDFVQSNWPEIYQQQRQQQQQQQDRSKKFDRNGQEWNDESASPQQWQTRMAA